MKPEFYAEYAQIQDQHWWFRGRRAILPAVLETSLPPTPGGRPRRLLDVGCGTGPNLAGLARFGQVCGLEVERGALEVCRASGQRGVVQGSSGQLPWRSETFDVVCAFDVLEHLDDDAGALAEMGRLLVPGGLLFLTVPAFQALWGPQDALSDHKRRYTATRLRAQLRHSGCAPRKLSYFNSLLFPPVALIRLARQVRPEPTNGAVSGGADGVKSDFSLTKPGLINDTLAALFGAERFWLRRASFPAGVSLLCIAEKAE